MTWRTWPLLAALLLLAGGCELDVTSHVPVDVDAVTVGPIQVAVTFTGAAADALADPDRQARLDQVWTDTVGQVPTVTVDPDGRYVATSALPADQVGNAATVTGLGSVTADPSDGQTVTVGVTLVRPDRLVEAFLAAGDDTAALTGAQLTTVAVDITWPDGWVLRDSDVAGATLQPSTGQVRLERTLADAAAGRATLVLGPAAGGGAIPVAVGGGTVAAIVAAAVWAARRGRPEPQEQDR